MDFIVIFTVAHKTVFRLSVVLYVPAKQSQHVVHLLAFSMELSARWFSSADGVNSVFMEIELLTHKLSRY